MPESNGSAPAAREVAPTSSDMPIDKKLTRFLGWFSLALGAQQLLMPGQVNRLIGVHDDERSRLAQRIVGAQELAAFAGIMSKRRPTAWLWSRVAGDVSHMALLGVAYRKRESDARWGFAVGNVATTFALDAYAATQRTRKAEAEDAGEEPSSGGTDTGETRVVAAITVNRPRDEVYSFWRRFEDLPAFMDHVESVSVDDTGSVHWVVKAPAGRTVEWDAELTEDVPGERISWRSLEGADVENSGTVRFADAPGGRGTEIHLDIDYSPPAGALGAGIAKLFGEEPRQQAKDDLRRFKQVMEAGEVVRSEGSPEGQTARRLVKQRAAQPPEDEVAATSKPDEGGES